MAEALGVVGLAYPIVKDLLKVAKKLRRLHKQIRNAKNELSSVIERTITVARTYDLFRETMAVARGIQGLAPLFKRHQQLIKSIDNESKRTIGSLRHITRRFRSLRRGKPISTVERLIAQFEWTRESKKTVPSLFQNMEVLERSMRTTATLVNIQLLSQTYQQDPSDAVMAQFELSRKTLRIEFDKLQHAQQVQKRLMMQQQISPSQHVKTEEFAQEIITILKREIPQLKNHQPAGSQSTSDSRSSPTSQISNEPSPITTPSLSLPSRSESQSVIKPEQDGDAPRPKRQISRKRRTRSAPSRIPSESSPPFPFSSDAEPDNYDSQGAGLDMHDQNLGEDQGGAYMRMPPFGSPRLVPLTSVRRPSPDRPDASSDTSNQQRKRHGGGSHPTRRRRNTSKISEYGDGGEVTATHRTGSVGLPSGSWKGKSRPDQ